MGLMSVGGTIVLYVAVDVTSSFAVPFEEDVKDPRVFYLDHDYLET
jgi:hypothetical protein